MATREELEAAIDEHPDQADNYLVLGDWLQERQDPRGELISLHRGKPKEVKARIAALQRELGPPAPRHVSLDWFYGFVRSLQMSADEDDRALLKTVLDHPSLRHLQRLDLGIAGDEEDERQWSIDAIAASPRPCLRSLHVHSFWRGGNEPPAGELDLTALWAALPRIAKVHAGARYITPGDLRSPTLRELTLDGEVTVPALAPLFAGSAPKLAELSLRDVDVGAFASALEASSLGGQLAKLELPNASGDVQQRILACCSKASFAPLDDDDPDYDPYEQVGE